MEKLDSSKANAGAKRSWWVLEFDVDAAHEDMASWLMIHIGANGCQFINSENGIVTLQASFEEDRITPDNLQAVYASLDEYGLGAVAGTIRVNKLEEEDWLAEWKKGMTPLRLGERFLVSPPWFEGKIAEEDLAGRNVIWIEPGMAFGTGFHATTQFCMQAIESHLSSLSKKKLEVLDVGTGSGILAIAAAQLLPDAHILAVEIDPTACKVAEENLVLNKADHQVELIEGSTEKVQGKKFDAILSNLTCEDNVALLKEYEEMLLPGGKLILSGILLEKKPIIEAAINQYALRIVEHQAREIWSGLVVERV